MQFCFSSEQRGDFKVDWNNKLSGGTFKMELLAVLPHSTFPRNRVWVGEIYFCFSVLFFAPCSKIVHSFYSTFYSFIHFIVYKKYLTLSWKGLSQERAEHTKTPLLYFIMFFCSFCPKRWWLRLLACFIRLLPITWKFKCFSLCFHFTNVNLINAAYCCVEHLEIHRCREKYERFKALLVVYPSPP